MAAYRAALARKVLWRVVLTVTGGLRVRGVTRLPDGPCVIVANHNSHADTAALIAALPARRRPAVAAAADYWFGGPAGRPRAPLPGANLRPWACKALCGAFPVRRGGGGMADLTAAGELLAAGRDVVIYPEGSRSRDGSVGEFRHGAARLAHAYGVPLVPVGIAGTREVLPASKADVRRRRARVTVRIGLPVQAGVTANIPAGTAAASGELAPATAGTHDSCRPGGDVSGAASQRNAVSGITAQARAQVVRLVASRDECPADRATARVAARSDRPDSPSRISAERFAVTWYAALLVAAWAFGEALSWPLLPELILAVLCVAAPRAGIRLSLAAAAGSVTGGAVGYLLAAHGITVPEPVTTVRMHASVATQVTAHGAAAVLAQPLSGIPFKVYVGACGARHIGLGRFLLDSARARGARILSAGLIMTGAGACARRWRRFYPAYLLAVVAVYVGGWSAVVAAWS